MNFSLLLLRLVHSADNTEVAEGKFVMREVVNGKEVQDD